MQGIASRRIVQFAALLAFPGAPFDTAGAPPAQDEGFFKTAPSALANRHGLREERPLCSPVLPFDPRGARENLAQFRRRRRRQGAGRVDPFDGVDLVA